jgi:hypothetical protein
MRKCQHFKLSSIDRLPCKFASHCSRPADRTPRREAASILNAEGAVDSVLNVAEQERWKTMLVTSVPRPWSD